MQMCMMLCMFVFVVVCFLSYIVYFNLARDTVHFSSWSLFSFNVLLAKNTKILELQFHKAQNVSLFHVLYIAISLQIVSSNIFSFHITYSPASGDLRAEVKWLLIITMNAFSHDRLLVML